MPVAVTELPRDVAAPAWDSQLDTLPWRPRFAKTPDRRVHARRSSRQMRTW